MQFQGSEKVDFELLRQHVSWEFRKSHEIRGPPPPYLSKQSDSSTEKENDEEIFRNLNCTLG